MSTHNFSNFENLNTLFTSIGNKLKSKIEGVNLTQAQYNALSPEEKMNGKAYFITDAEGGITPSAGKNIYSLNEQEDGTWIDGSKIYKKTFEIPTNSRDKVSISMNIANLNRVIKYEGGLSGLMARDIKGDVKKNIYIDLNSYIKDTSYTSGDWTEVYIDYTNNTIELYLGIYNTRYGATGYITIWYTKSLN